MIIFNAKLYLAVAYISIAAGVTAIFGWLFGIEILTYLVPSLPTMKLNTALGFILLGGILILSHKKQVYLTYVLSGLLLIIGAVSLGQNLFDQNNDFSQLFLGDQISKNSRGLMSSATAFCFLSLSIGIPLSLSQKEQLNLFGQHILHAVTLIAYLSLLGYVYGISNESRLSFISTMPVPTTLLFFGLSIVTTFKNPNLGITGLLVGSQPGNIVAQRMLIIIAVSALLIGLITTQIYRYHLVSTESTILIFGILVVAIYTFSVTTIASQINVLDEKRIQAENDLQNAYENLEVKVTERTKYVKDAIDLLTETNRIAKIGGWEVDMTTKAVKWTSVTSHIHEVPVGYKPEFQSAIEFYPEGEHRNNVMKAVNNAVSLGLSYDLELQIETAKGNRKWVRANGSPTFENGQCVKLNGTFQDIDIRKRAEIGLVEERKFLQTIIDHIPANIYAKDLENNIILVNASLMNFLNAKDRGDLIGKKEDDVLPEEYIIRFSDEEELNSKNEEGISKEVSIVMANRKKEWYLKSKLPLKAHDDKISGFLDLGLNVTQRKNNEEKLNKMAILKAKNREMEQFAYITSHDLKEPLLTIKSYAGLLLKTSSSELSADGLKYLETINKGATRMESLINALLDYSRLSKIEQPTTVNVNDTLTNVINGLEAAIQPSEAKIHYDTMPTLQAFPHLLELLFQNLITNAMKFMKPGFTPEISINARPLPDSGWEFSVRDNGIGISSENFDKIFTIFRRLHHKSEYPGTGIGLAHCQKIVELHNGKIWVESAEGMGSTFYFTIYT